MFTPDHFTLRGRRALITGGSSGLGTAMAQAFVGLGADVVINGSSADRLASAGAALKQAGAPVATVCGDLAVEAAAVVDAAAEKLGGLDIVIHSAAIRNRRGTANIDADAFRHILEVNLTATYTLARAALPHLAKSDAGRLIFITSLAATQARPGDPAYTASKGGVSALTRSLAVEFGSDSLTVNAISPGMFATDVNKPMVGNPGIDAFVNTRIPLKRWGRPEELASAAMFLALPASSYVNGVIVPVDGGQSAQM
ncbi:gluconate 5-dehydrogenase [Breoghania corrubedonensis]|uniref:Gluconate 5-dehydrogenase n=1 Tax=Breoghania corrubedonensis TaxID=665038 RepID=A0A2T5VF54_9HYPH|nr:SDR family oxidoreductase [Breoghania corrubedonensis]PTW62383.1 gluconate 5-dehydrogenase [Breoghania corrubedonensis]